MWRKTVWSCNTTDGNQGFYFTVTIGRHNEADRKLRKCFRNGWIKRKILYKTKVRCAWCTGTQTDHELFLEMKLQHNNDGRTVGILLAARSVYFNQQIHLEGALPPLTTRWRSCLTWSISCCSLSGNFILLWSYDPTKDIWHHTRWSFGNNDWGPIN